MMAAYHPLGFRRAFGAHLRYFFYGRVNGERAILGGLLFAAAAKAVEARDRLIGWAPDERSRYRHHIIANSGYLILPSVHVPHLASQPWPRRSDAWQGTSNASAATARPWWRPSSNLPGAVRAKRARMNGSRPRGTRASSTDPAKLPPLARIEPHPAACAPRLPQTAHPADPSCF